MECWIQIIFEANCFCCDSLLTHYSILPAFSPNRRLYEPEANISAEKPCALRLEP